MTARITDSGAQKAFRMLQNCGARGRELVEVLNRRGTRIRVTPRVHGGFTLNFLNTIFIMPLAANASEWTWNAWVALLAHEASHVEQGFWVDSVEQEIVAYSTQARVGDELGVDLGELRGFLSLNPRDTADQVRGRAALLALFGNTPAGIVYASLPYAQPQRVRAIMPGVREMAAVVRAALRGKQLSVVSNQ